ncbi:galactokinase family protein [Massilia sp. TWR1-2-2]|uniref:galactokinase family protein n=1 Tax=Massilia sp. TWR1-2-2 TaxID=2804584 RepID=UPI003CF0B73E
MLGEHTDYNDGFMLPIATPQRTTVTVGLLREPKFVFYSATLRSEASFGINDEAPPGFARYVFGCIRMLQASGIAVPPLRLHVDSNVPLGTGLSSSAALEVAPCAACSSSTSTTRRWRCWPSRPKFVTRASTAA